MLLVFHDDIVVLTVSLVEEVDEWHHKHHIVVTINYDGVCMSHHGRVRIFVLRKCPLIAETWEVHFELIIVSYQSVDPLVKELFELTASEPLLVIPFHVDQLIRVVGLQCLQPVIPVRERIVLVFQDSQRELSVVLPRHPIDLVKTRTHPTHALLLRVVVRDDHRSWYKRNELTFLDVVSSDHPPHFAFNHSIHPGFVDLATLLAELLAQHKEMLISEI